MQKQDTRPVIRFSEAGFKYMHILTIGIFYKVRSYSS